MGRLPLALTAVVGLAVGAAGYNLWQAGGQLGAALPSASPVSAESQPVPVRDAIDAQPAMTETPEAAAAEPVMTTDAFDNETGIIDDERGALPATDEYLESVAALNELLNDPDPDVRSEAAALLELWAGE